MGTKALQKNNDILYTMFGWLPSVRKLRLEISEINENMAFCRRSVDYHRKVSLAIQAELAFLRLIQRRNELFAEGHPLWDRITFWNVRS